MVSDSGTVPDSYVTFSEELTDPECKSPPVKAGCNIDQGRGISVW